MIPSRPPDHDQAPPYDSKRRLALCESTNRVLAAALAPVSDADLRRTCLAAIAQVADASFSIAGEFEADADALADVITGEHGWPYAMPTMSDIPTDGTVLVVALKPDDRVTGLIGLGKAAGHFDAQDRQAIDAIVSQAMSALESHRAQARKNTRLTNLEHRFRNILAIIRSMVGRSTTNKRGIEDYVGHLQARIGAMARTQALLARAVHDCADLETIVREEILALPAVAQTYDIGGPAVILTSHQAEVVGQALHELATNSVKFGAIGKPGGHIAIAWQRKQRNDGAWLSLTWRETGIDAQPSPIVEGFGAELILHRLPCELGGSSTMQFTDDSLDVKLEIPLSRT